MKQCPEKNISKEIDHDSNLLYFGKRYKKTSLTVVGVRAVRTIVNYLNTEPVMTDSVSAKICHNDI